MSELATDDEERCPACGLIACKFDLVDAAIDLHGFQVRSMMAAYSVQCKAIKQLRRRIP